MTQSCSLFQKIETPWGPVRFIMSSIVLPGGSDAVIIGQKTVREKLGIDVMAQLHASVLTAHGRDNGHEIETTAGAVGDSKAGAVLRVAMAVKGFGSDAPGDMDDNFTLTLLSKRPMMFKDAELEM